MKRTSFKFIALSIVVFSLQSCFVAKDYQQPDVVETQDFRTDSLTTEGENMAKISWRNMFTDTVLIGHIEEALQNNIDIRSAIQQIKIAQSYLNQAETGQYPTLGVEGTYTHQELSGNSQFGGLFSSLDQYQLTANLSWEADIWGKIESKERAARARYLQSMAAHKAVKTQLISGVASVYYQLLSVDEQIQITEETIDTRKQSLQTIQALKNAGMTNAVGVQQTQAQLFAAKGILIDLKKRRRLLENTMSILLADTPHSIKRTDLDDQEITTDLKTGVPAELLSNRPDVIAAEYNYRQAFQMTNVARSKFYPSITISATGGLKSLSIGDLFDTGSLFATLVGGITQPIFQHRKIQTQYEVAQAQQKQAKLNLRQTFLTATKEVSDALYAYQAASKKIKIKKKQLKANTKAVQYSQQLLKNGLANYLEVLNARENKLSSKLDLVKANFNQLKAIIELYVAVGGGW